jgi:hypothetical protein
VSAPQAALLAVFDRLEEESRNLSMKTDVVHFHLITALGWRNDPAKVLEKSNLSGMKAAGI